MRPFAAGAFGQTHGATIPEVWKVLLLMLQKRHSQIADRPSSLGAALVYVNTHKQPSVVGNQLPVETRPREALTRESS
jgi:hypothetical protein